MLAPQFSLRRLLAWVTASAFVCLIVAAAARGQLWAAGVLIALLGLAVMIAVHGVTFGLLCIVGAVRDRIQGGRAAMPPLDAAPPGAAADQAPS